MTPAAAALLALAITDTLAIAPGRRAVLPLDVAEPSRIVYDFTVMSAGPGVRSSAEVWVHADLAPLPASATPRELSPVKRTAVVAISVLFLIATGAYASRRLRAALRDRKPNPIP